MIIESLGLVARRETRKELHAALSFLLGPTRVESGCLSCHLLQDLTNPNGLRFECLWTSEDDLIRHLRSEVYRQLLILMELSAETPSVKFHKVSETQGLEYVHAARQQESATAWDYSSLKFAQSKQEKTP
jgi:quinol monooxygenase YgiN